MLMSLCSHFSFGISMSGVASVLREQNTDSKMLEPYSQILRSTPNHRTSSWAWDLWYVFGSYNTDLFHRRHWRKYFHTTDCVTYGPRRTRWEKASEIHHWCHFHCSTMSLPVSLSPASGTRARRTHIRPRWWSIGSRWPWDDAEWVWAHSILLSLCQDVSYSQRPCRKLRPLFFRAILSGFYQPLYTALNFSRSSALGVSLVFLYLTV
jgi:hypothetical protein